MATDWVNYKCKSGQTLFIYNKATGEHKWPAEFNKGLAEGVTMQFEPIIYKEVSSIAIQTDDNGCDNGCTSMYINSNISGVFYSPETSLQPQPGVSVNVQHEQFDTDPQSETLMNGHHEIDDNHSTLEVKVEQGQTRDMDEINTMLSVLEELDFSSAALNENEAETPNDFADDDNVEKNYVREEFTPQQSEKSPNPCSYCGKTFSRKSRLIAHIRKHTGETPDDIADDELIDKNYVQEEKEEFTPQQSDMSPNTCSYCRRVFSRKSRLIAHIRKHTGERPFECTICKKRFTRNSSLKSHISYSHTGDQPLECSYCKQKFMQQSHLNVHLRKHTGERPYECSTCNKKFARIGNLNYHKKNHNNEKSFACSYCEHKSRTRFHLKSHLRTHTGEKPYECHICNKKFAQSNQLTVHVRRHKGDKSFQCSHCEKTFVQKSALEAHIRSHTGERPFECPYPDCDKTFVQRTSLNIHIRVHKGKKNYECSYCKKTFTQNCTLDVHLRTHTGERPYECSYCKQTFRQKYNFDVHLRKHTGEKPFECSQCEDKFISRAQLRKHLKTHTG